MSAPVDQLAATAAAHPDKPAVIEDRPGHSPAVWSWAELDRQANRFANALLALGIRPGDPVVWCGMNSFGVVRAMHGGRRLGLTLVPLNYRLTPEEAAFIVDDCDAVAVCADAAFAEFFTKVKPATPKLRHVLVWDGEPAAGQESLDALLETAAPTPPPAGTCRASDRTMVYTSGTTGRPKGAVRSAFGNPDLQRQLIAFIGYVPDDVHLTTGPLYHSAPGGFLTIAHSLGHTAVIQRKFDAEDWLRLIAKYRVTTSFCAPTPIRLVCQLPAAVLARYDRSSMRRMVANAAPWSFALKEQYLELFPEDSLFELYGSTELGVCTILGPADQRRKPGSCGRPAPGVEVTLFDEAGRRIGQPRVAGELYVRSESAFKTYHKAQEKFEECRRDDWLSVGDIAYFDEEGYFYICDRKNDTIISGGMNVYPAEVEAALERHPDVLDVAVIGIPSETWGEAVHAVVKRANETLTAEALIEWAREHLAGYKIPRSISWTDEIPRNTSGKILKKDLREPFWAGRDRRVG